MAGDAEIGAAIIEIRARARASRRPTRSPARSSDWSTWCSTPFPRPRLASCAEPLRRGERTPPRGRPRGGRATTPAHWSSRLGPHGHPGDRRDQGRPRRRPTWRAALLRAGVTGLGDSRVENLAALRRRRASPPTTLIRVPDAQPGRRRRPPRRRELEHRGRSCSGRSRRGCDTPGDHPRGRADGGARRPPRGHAATTTSSSAPRSVARPGPDSAAPASAPTWPARAASSPTSQDGRSSRASPTRSRAPSGTRLAVVSGGNSASLGWALSSADVGRVNELRLGEAILLGTRPARPRARSPGCVTDAFHLVAEVIEVKTKPGRPWGDLGPGGVRGGSPRHRALPAARRNGGRSSPSVARTSTPTAWSPLTAWSCSAPAATTSSSTSATRAVRR